MNCDTRWKPLTRYYLCCITAAMVSVPSAAARAIVPADGWPVARVAPSGKVRRAASVIMHRIIGLLVRIRQTGVVVWSNGNLGKYIICLTSYNNMR